MTALMSPKVWAAIALAFVLSLAGFFLYRAGKNTVRVEFDQYKIDQAETQRIAAKARAALGDRAATAHETFKATEEVRYVNRTKIIRQIVGRPVYSTACWDADGLRVANDAIAGRDSTSEPAAAVPGPADPAR